MIKGLKPSAKSVIEALPALWWRIHPHQHGGKGFNKASLGNARFSPIQDKTGTIIPTLYAASTVKVALMETVLHDAPSPSEGFILGMPDKAQEVRELTGFNNLEPLKLADFSAIGLKRLGLTRTNVIDSDKTHYPETRLLAQWVHEHCQQAQGIQWTSRQDDRGLAVVLFGDRIKLAKLQVSHPGKSIADDDVMHELLDLLDGLGAGLIFPANP
jgi:hypothetical protein